MKIGAARTRRSPPSIGAVPGGAAATRRLAIVHTFTAHIANPSWSHGELSDPLPEPPANFSLAGDDDELEPFDLFLILRPTLKLTDSG